MIFKPLLIHKIAAGQKTRSACSGGRMRGTKMPPRDVESPGADTRGRASHVQAKIRQRAGGKRVTRAYQAYLQSAEWKARRQATLTRDGHRCTACQSTERLEAHHLTYERVGFERPGDLVTLCHLCHMLEHGRSPTGGGPAGLTVTQLTQLVREREALVLSVAAEEFAGHLAELREQMYATFQLGASTGALNKRRARSLLYASRLVQLVIRGLYEEFAPAELEREAA